jgi:hypothetical protein
MVDRHVRDIAANVLRQFMEGSISNEEYEQKYPRTKSDPALREIFLQIWFFYSDIEIHKLTGKYALNDECRALAERCILFLKSDVEFEWPPQKFGFRYGILRLLGFGRILKQRDQRETSIGDHDVWPFFRHADYELHAGAQKIEDNQ